MANKPISMSKIRHVLQLHSQGRSKLLISQQTGMARNTIKKYIKEFNQSGLNFKEVNELSDKDLEDLFIHPDEKPLKEKHKIQCFLVKIVHLMLTIYIGIHPIFKTGILFF